MVEFLCDQTDLNKDIDVFGKTFHDNGGKIHISEATPIGFALSSTHPTVDLMKIFVRHKADMTKVDGQGGSVYHAIAQQGLVEVVKYLCEILPPEILFLVDANGKTPLDLCNITVQNNK